MTPNPPSACQRCGASLAPGASFCPRCGTGIPVQRPWSGPTLATPTGANIEVRPDAAEAQLAALRRATLGQYEILVEVGRGGMATVYLAHDLALDRKVAIKVLAPALLLMGEGMVERFKREARTATASSTATSSPRTSCWTRKDGPSSPTSASQRWCRRKDSP